MKQKDGTYAPEGIVEGSIACESCLDPNAHTVRFTGLDGRTFDVCRDCWVAAGDVHWWHPEPIDGW